MVVQVGYRLAILGVSIISILFLFACTDDNKEDLETIHTEIIRMDRLLDAKDLSDSITNLLPNDNEFVQIYLQQILKIRDWTDASAVDNRLQDSFSLHLYQVVQQNFDDLSQEERRLGSLFEKMGDVFEDFHKPTTIACITAFEIGVFTIGRDYLGIGLDFFLGKESALYPTQIFPEHIQQYMSRSYLVPRCAQVLLQEYIPPRDENQFIDFMINNGIIMWLKEQILGDLPLHVVLEFTEQELEWLQKNESEIWGFFLREELLYNSNYRDFQKLIDYSPGGISGMPDDAPGRTGNYIGYQIVSSLMSKNNKLTVNELLNMSTKDIMAKSKFKPRRL